MKIHFLCIIFVFYSACSCRIKNEKAIDRNYLFVELKPIVKEKVRSYISRYNINKGHILYISISNTKSLKQECYIYSSIDINSVYFYEPNLYSKISDNYIGICSGVNNISNTKLPTHDIYNKFLKNIVAVDSDDDIITSTYNPPVWKVEVYMDKCIVIDSMAMINNDRGINSAPPPAPPK